MEYLSSLPVAKDISTFRMLCSGIDHWAAMRSGFLFFFCFNSLFYDCKCYVYIRAAMCLVVAPRASNARISASRVVDDGLEIRREMPDCLVPRSFAKSD